MNAALSYFKQAVTTGQEFKLLNSIDYVIAVRNMGRSYVLSGEHNNAIRYFLSSARLVVKHKHRNPISGVLIQDISNIKTNVNQRKISRILKQLGALV